MYEDPRDLWDDPLKQALRAVTVLRLFQMLPPRWQKEKCEHDEPPNEWLVQWRKVAGTRVEPDAPRFLADSGGVIASYMNGGSRRDSLV